MLERDNDAYLSRGIDYLGALGAKLRDLQGFKTLARELIQNADDARATSMVFDIRDDMLIVENNGVFSDCGHVEDAECPWKNDPNKGHRCDFHRFRYIAAGDKRSEAETTGAFGIGFIAVYQITDYPELISGGRHWFLDETKPENQRIKECRGCNKCKRSDLPGTRFILPWVFDPNSPLRKALNAEAITKDAPEKLFIELMNSLPTAMIFLKHLDSIEVRQNGLSKCKFEREIDGNELIITQGNPDKDQIWYLISGDFYETAKDLRLKYPQIEEKRSTKISIAIPRDTSHDGMLCAYLPTEDRTGLPFHINADFFPTNDRKRVIFDHGYQATWNKEAIKASARLLGKNIHLLPKILGPKWFWSFLEQVKNVHSKDKDLFGEFWKNIEPQLKTAKIVFTSANEWVISKDAVFLKHKDENNAIPILEKMGLNIVHEDLRPYRKLLTAEFVGVPTLDIARICQAFEELGIMGRIEADKCPPFFNKRSARVSLWKEIKLLLDRQLNLSKNKEKDIEQLKKVPIGPGRDGAFWPCGQLFRADEETISLFNTINIDIPFVADDTEFAPLAKLLCPEFTVSHAIDYSKKSDISFLLERWKSGKIDLRELLKWFEKHRDIILNNEDLKSKFISLHIFPSSGSLYKLSDLSMPGDFNDPLGLAKLIDLTVIEESRDFLVKLGINKLDFRIYAKQYLPDALKKTDLPSDKRRKAIKLLAEKIGEIKDEYSVRDAIASSPVVECEDNEFRQASVCYFDTQDVRNCLGDRVPFVRLLTDCPESVRDLYKWLGVADVPRYDDLVKRIREISNSCYSAENVKIIKIIMTHLSKRLGKDKDAGLDNECYYELEPLRELFWLPVEGKTDRWYRPSEVYAPYRKVIFESQAYFLDIPSKSQIKLLLEFLRIRSEPDVSLVVKHVLHCSSNKLPLHNEVYKFLNNHATNPALEQLRDKKCLYFEDKYWEPSKVFWGDHPFGKYRRKLDRSLREFDKFFKSICVKECPDYQDALEVLKEISEEFGTKNTPIDNETNNILLECWRMLDKSLQSNQLTKDEIRDQIKGVKSVPDKRKILNLPERMFFENSVGLAEKFEGFLEYNVIPQPLGASRAMLAAGVRLLSSAVDVQLLEHTNPIENELVRERIFKRKNQLARVLEVEHNNVLPRLKILEQVKYIEVTSLKVKYILHAFNNQLESKPESVKALYHKKKKQLLFTRFNDQVPWPAIARELAIALFPEEEPGKIALNLKSVLYHERDEEVESELDMLGLPKFDTNVSSTQFTTNLTVNTLGKEIIPGVTTSITHKTKISKSKETANNVIEKITSETEMNYTEKHDIGITYLNSVINYKDELEKIFNRPGDTTLHNLIIDDGKVRNTERRREKIYNECKNRLLNEPAPNERRKETIRTILEGPDEQVREYLLQLYGGKCQICGKTFPQRDGSPFFIANYIVPRKLARFVDNQANALCLCADHFARWQHGAIESKDIVDQIYNFKTESEGGYSQPILRIKLCGEECEIKFKEKHLLDLQELLEASESEGI